MKTFTVRQSGVLKWSGRLAGAMFLVTLTGCSPDGAESIKIGDPNAVRSKYEGGGAGASKAGTEKPSRALELDAEAAKKNPKLH